MLGGSVKRAAGMSDSPQRIPWNWILLIGAVPGVVAVLQLGRIHPDEVYQWLEPAFYRARGYGVLSWEWSAGIRNWAIPMLLAGLLKGSDALGIANPRLYRAVLEVPQYLLHVAMLAAVFRYGARRVGAERGGWAAALVGLTAAVTVFAGRTTGESFSAAFLVIALATLDDTRSAGRIVFAGAMLGAAIVARYASAVPFAAAMIYLVTSRQWRTAAVAAVGLALVGAGLGTLDWLTWGRPFHSLIAYVDFNVVSGGAARRFGTAPAWYFVPVLARALPAWAWLGLAFAIARCVRRAADSPSGERTVLDRAGRPSPHPSALPVVSAGCTLIALSAVPHKEERFIYPVLVLFALAAAPFFLAAARAAPAAGKQPPASWLFARKRIAWLAILALATNAIGFAFPGELRAERGDEFRAIVQTTHSPDARGLLIVNEGLWGAGGFFYIGKRIPWLTCDWPRDPNFRLAIADPRFNRAVTYDGRALDELQASGFEVSERIDEATVLFRR